MYYDDQGACVVQNVLQYVCVVPSVYCMMQCVCVCCMQCVLYYAVCLVLYSVCTV